jgi:hypothetical protein
LTEFTECGGHGGLLTQAGEGDVAKRAKVAPGTGDDAIGASIERALAPASSPATAADGTRCMVTLSAGALHLLDTAVLVDGIDRSAVVEALILANLSQYFSGKNGAAAATAE